ncbi:MAG: hypothetical protein HXX08_15180 [Chloroflexi bacterium]|uniref:Uncharacterized protein n=1 Tax=Candidatus Chlorohelix allophototropha TaxID=3003348 RepID=A0A8T7M560_9CHLR|nr:hypothetical protein [Chloroflexota bacterium]WJW69114.1 hypothetical protein OZ401_002707 [Chloroflexota bacterium L227-S17]
MLEEIDPTKIKDKETRQVVIKVLNLLENAFEQIDKLRAENQQLQDENNRLKGEQGKPNVRANKNTHFSSETERKSAKTAKRENTLSTIIWKFIKSSYSK